MRGRRSRVVRAACGADDAMSGDARGGCERWMGYFCVCVCLRTLRSREGTMRLTVKRCVRIVAGHRSHRRWP